MNRQPSLDNSSVSRLQSAGHTFDFSIHPGSYQPNSIYVYNFDGDTAFINFAKCDHSQYEKCIDDCKMLVLYGPSKLDLHRWQYEHNRIYSLVLHHFKLYVRDIIADTYNGICPRITFEI